MALLTSRRLDVPPILVKTVEKEPIKNTDAIMEPIHPYFKRHIYEIWKLYLEDVDNTGINEVYILVSAKYKVSGYEQGTWEEFQYNGFYTTENEAEQMIDSMLN